MNEPCLFCDIANKKASARIVYEDDVCLWLNELSEIFGFEQKIRVIGAVENYLAEPQKARDMVQKYLDAI